MCLRRLSPNFRNETNKAVKVSPIANDDNRPAAPSEPKIGDKMQDGTVYAGKSPRTGKPMYTTPADAPLTMTFNDASDYAKKLDAHGHQDWRVPNQDELDVLFNNRAAIGGFDVSGSNPAGWYWSRTQNGNWTACAQRFSDGFQGYDSEVFRLSVRCVR